MKKRPVIIILIVAVVLGSIAWVVLSRPKLAVQDPYARYKLPPDFDKADLQQMIEVMRADAEFAPYFAILDETHLQQVCQEAFEVILSSRSSSDVLAAIKDLNNSIRAQGAVFYYLDYNDAYIESPDDYPILHETFWSFIKDEFKMTVLAVFYKVHYDRQFTFQWDETSVLAARKLREIWLLQEAAHQKK